MQGDIDEGSGRDSDRTNTNGKPPCRFTSSGNPPPPEEQHALHSTGTGEDEPPAEKPLNLGSVDRRPRRTPSEEPQEGHSTKAHPPEQEETPQKGEDTHTRHAPPNGAEHQVQGTSVEGAENPAQRRETAKRSESEGAAEEEGALNSVHEAPDLNGVGESSGYEWTRADLDRRKTFSRETEQSIIRHHPDFAPEGAVRRFVYLVAFGGLHDRDTGLPLVPWQLLDWVIGEGKRFTTNGGEYWNARRVLEYLRQETTLGPNGPGPALQWNRYKANEQCRTIETVGLHCEARAAIREDLTADPSTFSDRVYVLTGEPMHKNHAGRRRDKIKEQLADEVENAPSDTSARVLRHMNEKPPRTFSKIQEHVPEAIERVENRPYDVDLTWDGRVNYEARENRIERIRGYQRRFDLSVLRSVAHQHKPFYKFSPKGRTDRIFPANHSALYLPSDVRKVLCQDFHEIDLKSAHLMIAAWLWGARRAKEKLRRDDYSVWADLFDHFEPLIAERYDPFGLPESERGNFKGALKGALYSVVFGMPASNVKGNLTSDMKTLLGEEAGSKAGKHFARHELIRDLLDARERQFRQIERLGGMEAADDRWVRLDTRREVAKREGRPNPNRAGAAKVLGTVAQSYEMELMSVVVDCEQHREARDARNYFKVAFWLHDGVYVQARSIDARMEDLSERLEQKANELDVHARFEHEPIDPPK